MREAVAGSEFPGRPQEPLVFLLFRAVIELTEQCIGIGRLAPNGHRHGDREYLRPLDPQRVPMRGRRRLPGLGPCAIEIIVKEKSDGRGTHRPRHFRMSRRETDSRRAPASHRRIEPPPAGGASPAHSRASGRKFQRTPGSGRRAGHHRFCRACGRPRPTCACHPCNKASRPVVWRRYPRAGRRTQKSDPMKALQTARPVRPPPHAPAGSR